MEWVLATFGIIFPGQRQEISLRKVKYWLKFKVEIYLKKRGEEKKLRKSIRKHTKDEDKTLQIWSTMGTNWESVQTMRVGWISRTGSALKRSMWKTKCRNRNKNSRKPELSPIYLIIVTGNDNEHTEPVTEQVHIWVANICCCGEEYKKKNFYKNSNTAAHVNQTVRITAGCWGVEIQANRGKKQLHHTRTEWLVLNSHSILYFISPTCNVTFREERWILLSEMCILIVSPELQFWWEVNRYFYE